MSIWGNIRGTGMDPIDWSVAAISFLATILFWSVLALLLSAVLAHFGGGSQC